MGYIRELEEKEVQKVRTKLIERDDPSAARHRGHASVKSQKCRTEVRVTKRVMGTLAGVCVQGKPGKLKVVGSRGAKQKGPCSERSWDP